MNRKWVSFFLGHPVYMFCSKNKKNNDIYVQMWGVMGFSLQKHVSMMKGTITVG